MLLLLLGSAFAVLRIKFEGEDLGETVASILNKRMRGRISIRSIEWDTASLKQVFTGGWVPVRVRGVKVWDDCALTANVDALDDVRLGDPNDDCTPDERPDPDPNSKRKPRKLLLRTELITAELDVHAVMFGNHDFVLRNVWVHGGEALLEETREPYPLHAYDKTIVSLVTAFYPRKKPGFSAGIYAESAPPIFDLRDIHIKDLNLTVHFVPSKLANGDVSYGFAARLENVNVDSDTTCPVSSADYAECKRKNHAYLYMDGNDPLVPKFYVRLAVQADKGTIRVLDEGPSAAFRLPLEGPSPTPEAWPPPGRTALYDIAVTNIRLDRLAQLPTQWPRHDFVANTLELDLSMDTLPCPTELDQHPDPKLGAKLRLSGELHDYWDRPYDGSWNLRLDTQNLGPTVRSCIKATVGGDDLHGAITLTGPFIAAPKVGLDLKNLDFDIPLSAAEEPVRLTLAEVHGGIDLVNEQGFIDRTKALIRGGKEPGEVEVSATFGLKPLYANAQVEITKAIDVARFLPPQAVSAAGKFLKGRLRARGDTELGFALEDFDLSLGTTPAEKRLRVYEGRLFTPDAFDSLHIENVRIDAGATRALIDGTIDLVNLYSEDGLVIEGIYPDLGTWLTRFGQPSLARMVSGAMGGTRIVIKGPLKNPTVNVNTTLEGVPCVDKLRLVDTTFADGIVDIRRMSSQGLGGELTGSGRVRVDGAAPFIEKLQLSGRRIDAGRVCGVGTVIKGTLDTVEAKITSASIDKNRSPLDWIDFAEVYAKAPKLKVMGDPYSDVALCLNRKDDTACRPRPLLADVSALTACAVAKKSGGSCIVATARRDGGGVIDATVAKLAATKNGRTVVPGRLGGAISIDLPLAVLDQFIGGAVHLGGESRTTLHLAGTPNAPQASGHITLLRTWFERAFVGDTQLRVEPVTLATGKPGVRIVGKTLTDRLEIDGMIGTTAPYPVQLAVTAHRLELDVVNDLNAMLGIKEPLQAWVSGTITVKTELAPTRPVEPEAWIELTEVVAIVNHRAADGRLIPLRLSVIDQQPGARAAVSMRVTPSTLELACKNPAAPGGREPCSTRIATPAGVIEVRGHANASSVAIEALGTLDLALIAPLLDDRFDEASGFVRLAASVAGTFANPSFEASLDLDPEGAYRRDPKTASPVRFRPIGGDTVLEAPTGLIKLANGSLGFTDVVLQVRDQHLDEQGELHVKGNITLDGLTPANWSVLISGKVAGKMLMVAAPGAVSQAGGLATIEGYLSLTGKGLMPLVSGTILFDTPAQGRPIAVIPRGVGREIKLDRGGLDIETVTDGDRRTYVLAMNQIGGEIGGEGRLSNIAGELQIENGELTSLDVSLDADNVPFRLAGTLDVTLSARNIHIDKAGANGTLSMRGNISIIDGKYTKNVNLTEQLRSIGSSSAATKPFWEEYPSLGNAELYLSLEVRRFVVQNNLANITLVGPLIEITNTPRDPRMSGSIRVEQGRFQIPGTRATFSRTTGSVDFAENQKAGDPQLSITAEDPDYRDLSGQEHAITLTLTGALSNPLWDLKTSTGLNKSQTLSLLLLGRSQESLRRSLGDQTLGTALTNQDPTTNPSQGFADQIVKDLAGDWVSSLVGNSLTDLTGLDVVRVEIGFGSIGVKLEKNILANIRVIGDYEQTIRGTTTNIRGEWRTPLRITIQGGWLIKDFEDPAEQDISDQNLKASRTFRLWTP
ncbi:MAG: translocation/assembly module TamB domain-containing protein [Kofleriaceae bacterium]|nr:translocation/assembly module TamB domain-containing protein [Kofleriaceae bacterium]